MLIGYDPNFPEKRGIACILKTQDFCLAIDDQRINCLLCEETKKLSDVSP